MDEIYYGVLMNKVMINACVFAFLPISIVEGKIEERDVEIEGVLSDEKEKLFIDKLNNSYYLAEDSSFVEENEPVVSYVVSKKEVLSKYNLSIDEALNEYYYNIFLNTNIGVYSPEDDTIKMMIADFENINQSVKQIGIASNDSTDENSEEYDTYDTVFMSKDCFDELLNINDYKKLHDKLVEIKKNVEETGEYYVKKLDFDSFSNKDVIQFFNNFFDFLEKLTLEEVKTSIKEFINNLKNLAIYMDKFKCENLVDIQDSLYELCDEVSSLSEGNDVDNIKSEIKLLKKKYSTLFDLVSNTFEENVKVDTKNEVVKEEITSTQNKKTENKKINVRSIKKYIDEIAIGQEEAKRDAIQTIYMNSKMTSSSNKNSCLLLGPTGSGKTLIVETIGAYLDKPCVSIDTTQLTMPGYKGADIEDYLIRLIDNAKGDINKAMEGIVIFDEIDKKGSDSNSDVSGKGVLNTLLAFIQGTVYDFEYKKRLVHFDTSKLTVYATGAFTDVNMEISKNSIGFNTIKESNEDIKYSKLEVDDLSKIGGIPIELLGRFSTITQLSGHTRESLRKIILNSKESALLSEKEKLALDDIILSWTDDYIDALATHALKLKAGARSIKKAIETSIKNARWEALYNDDLYKSIILTKDTVEDNNNAILIDKFGISHNLKDILEAKEKTDLLVINESEEEKIKKMKF